MSTAAAEGQHLHQLHDGGGGGDAMQSWVSRLGEWPSHLVPMRTDQRTNARFDRLVLDVAHLVDFTTLLYYAFPSTSACSSTTAGGGATAASGGGGGGGDGQQQFDAVFRMDGRPKGSVCLVGATFEPPAAAAGAGGGAGGTPGEGAPSTSASSSSLWALHTPSHTFYLKPKSSEQADVMLWQHLRRSIIAANNPLTTDTTIHLNCTVEDHHHRQQQQQHQQEGATGSADKNSQQKKKQKKQASYIQGIYIHLRNKGIVNSSTSSDGSAGDGGVARGGGRTSLGSGTLYQPLQHHLASQQQQQTSSSSFTLVLPYAFGDATTQIRLSAEHLLHNVLSSTNSDQHQHQDGGTVDNQNDGHHHAGRKGGVTKSSAAAVAVCPAARPTEQGAVNLSVLVAQHATPQTAFVCKLYDANLHQHRATIRVYASPPSHTYAQLVLKAKNIFRRGFTYCDPICAIREITMNHGEMAGKKKVAATGANTEVVYVSEAYRNRCWARFLPVTLGLPMTSKIMSQQQQQHQQKEAKEDASQSSPSHQEGQQGLSEAEEAPPAPAPPPVVFDVVSDALAILFPSYAHVAVSNASSDNAGGAGSGGGVADGGGHTNEDDDDGVSTRQSSKRPLSARRPTSAARGGGSSSRVRGSAAVAGVGKRPMSARMITNRRSTSSSSTASLNQKSSALLNDPHVLVSTTVLPSGAMPPSSMSRRQLYQSSFECWQATQSLQRNAPFFGNSSQFRQVSESAELVLEVIDANYSVTERPTIRGGSGEGGCAPAVMGSGQVPLPGLLLRHCQQLAERQQQQQQKFEDDDGHEVDEGGLNDHQQGGRNPHNSRSATPALLTTTGGGGTTAAAASSNSAAVWHCPLDRYATYDDALANSNNSSGGNNARKRTAGGSSVSKKAYGDISAANFVTFHQNELSEPTNAQATGKRTTQHASSNPSVITVESAQVRRRYSFLDYICGGGTSLSCTIGIDFCVGATNAHRSTIFQSSGGGSSSGGWSVMQSLIAAINVHLNPFLVRGGSDLYGCGVSSRDGRFSVFPIYQWPEAFGVHAEESAHAQHQHHPTSSSTEQTAPPPEAQKSTPSTAAKLPFTSVRDATGEATLPHYDQKRAQHVRSGLTSNSLQQQQKQHEEQQQQGLQPTSSGGPSSASDGLPFFLCAAIRRLASRADALSATRAASADRLRHAGFPPNVIGTNLYHVIPIVIATPCGDAPDAAKLFAKLLDKPYVFVLCFVDLPAGVAPPECLKRLANVITVRIVSTENYEQLQESMLRLGNALGAIAHSFAAYARLVGAPPPLRDDFCPLLSEQLLQHQQQSLLERELDADGEQVDVEQQPHQDHQKSDGRLSTQDHHRRETQKAKADDEKDGEGADEEEEDINEVLFNDRASRFLRAFGLPPNANKRKQRAHYQNGEGHPHLMPRHRKQQEQDEVAKAELADEHDVGELMFSPNILSSSQKDEDGDGMDRDRNDDEDANKVRQPATTSTEEGEEADAVVTQHQKKFNTRRSDLKEEATPAAGNDEGHNGDAGDHDAIIMDSRNNKNRMLTDAEMTVVDIFVSEEELLRRQAELRRAADAARKTTSSTTANVDTGSGLMSDTLIRRHLRKLQESEIQQQNHHSRRRDSSSNRRNLDDDADDDGSFDLATSSSEDGHDEGDDDDDVNLKVVSRGQRGARNVREEYKIRVDESSHKSKRQGGDDDNDDGEDGLTVAERRERRRYRHQRAQADGEGAGDEDAEGQQFSGDDPRSRAGTATSRSRRAAPPPPAPAGSQQQPQAMQQQQQQQPPLTSAERREAAMNEVVARAMRHFQEPGSSPAALKEQFGFVVPEPPKVIRTPRFVAYGDTTRRAYLDYRQRVNYAHSARQLSVMRGGGTEPQGEVYSSRPSSSLQQHQTSPRAPPNARPKQQQQQEPRRPQFISTSDRRHGRVVHQMSAEHAASLHQVLSADKTVRGGPELDLKLVQQQEEAFEVRQLRQERKRQVEIVQQRQRAALAARRAARGVPGSPSGGGGGGGSRSGTSGAPFLSASSPTPGGTRPASRATSRRSSVASTATVSMRN